LWKALLFINFKKIIVTLKKYSLYIKKKILNKINYDELLNPASNLQSTFNLLETNLNKSFGLLSV
jgi:hypothetical protein